MIISFEHKFAFIHNPKVGGTSIRKAIAQYHDAPTTYWHQGWDTEQRRVQDMAHIPRDDLPGNLRQWLKSPDVFVFGFVRNPISRFFSALAEFRRQHADWYPASMETNEFIRCFMTEANTRYDWRFVHFCPQHYFFCDEGRMAVDFFGSHEQFTPNWGTIKSMLQLRGLTIPELSNERHRQPSENAELTPESLEILHRLYDIDCRMFNYPAIVDDIGCGTHEYRVSQIHDPRILQSQKLSQNLTDGERIAYDQVIAERVRRKSRRNRE